MGAVSGPELAAAVTKAGGLGVMGGIRWSPEALLSAIKKLKEELNDENAAFGVDLLLPQLGGNARKTNYDYTKGQLPALVDIMIQEKCRLFVCAVGVPPKWVVDKLHAAKIPVMIGAPKHAIKALAVGVADFSDAICAQGGEAGGHTGEIPTSILVPAVVDVCRGKKSPLTGQQVSVVAAGGIFDGRGLAMSLCMGAEALVRIYDESTRFVAAAEANSSPRHKRAIVQGGYTDTVRTLIFSGRPMRVIKTPYIENWEANRQADIAALTKEGLIPYEWEMDEKQKKGEEVSAEVVIQSTRMLAGQVLGAIDAVKPAAEIVNEYPILLAGMGSVAGPELVAAVSKAGGLGVIGGIAYTPEGLKQAIRQVKDELKDENAPFGVDLLLPQVGGNARATNYDYTKGKLGDLIDIMIAEKCRLFVSAVGVPPKLVGAPKHVTKALSVGVDIICAQGGEGGGHTGEIATSVLIPKVVDICKGYKSPLTGGPVSVVAAGGIFDGRGVAMSLCMGADAVWVGTRFVAAKEANSSPMHKRAVVDADFTDTIRTIIFSGRPMRVLKNPYIINWETNRADEIKALTSKGIIPVIHELDEKQKKGEELSTDLVIQSRPFLAGQVSGAISSIKTSEEIVNEMMTDCVKTLKHVQTLIAPTPKL
ncbi:hypothetical protein HDU93_004688 [Gonapodya sp. JEL0774]|nr:hypothetical protein HDU93_004688 [Gonapodya sp. JEL0774]